VVSDQPVKCTTICSTMSFTCLNPTLVTTPYPFLLLYNRNLRVMFLDTTPIGRILNRFSKDIYTVDEVLPRTFQGYIRTLFIVLSVLTVNSIGNPFYILFVIPLGILYLYFQKYCKLVYINSYFTAHLPSSLFFLDLTTSRELKRLDSTSRSPVFAHFQETLSGVSTIRAYKQENRFIRTNEDRVDYNQRAYYPSVASNRWLAVRLELIGSFIVFGSALFAVLTVGSISAR
jgi:ATP-binding cassette, subfamily C (CFTR/MRP), member 1